MSKTRESRWDGKLESLLSGTSSGSVLDNTALPQDEPLLILGYELNASNGLEGNGVFTGRNLDEQSQPSELELSQFDSMPLIQSQDDRERLPVAVHELL
jgi:hypothetical protein